MFNKMFSEVNVSTRTTRFIIRYWTVIFAPIVNQNLFTKEIKARSLQYGLMLGNCKYFNEDFQCAQKRTYWKNHVYSSQRMASREKVNFFKLPYYIVLLRCRSCLPIVNIFIWWHGDKYHRPANVEQSSEFKQNLTATCLLHWGFTHRSMLSKFESILTNIKKMSVYRFEFWKFNELLLCPKYWLR